MIKHRHGCGQCCSVCGQAFAVFLAARTVGILDPVGIHPGSYLAARLKALRSFEFLCGFCTGVRCPHGLSGDAEETGDVKTATLLEKEQGTFAWWSKKQIRQKWQTPKYCMQWLFTEVSNGNFQPTFVLEISNIDHKKPTFSLSFLVCFFLQV